MNQLRILYLQFTNPGGYPALHHSSRIFARKGWDVLFVGTEASGTRALTLPSHPHIQSCQLPLCAGGWAQRLHYVRFAVWALVWSLRWRPQWVYASDPLSCPVALALSRQNGVKVIYHEHDAPVEPGPTGPEMVVPPGKTSRRAQVESSSLNRRARGLVLGARRQLAQRAAICILPNADRVERFRESTGREGPTRCVWNCPSREEALVEPEKDRGAILHYHGNLGPELLPLTVIQALALVEGMTLQVIGYATRGQEGYVSRLEAEAASLGITDRVRFEPAMPRREVLARTRKASVGLALMPVKSKNPNFQMMVGASNKPFDYLACGVPLLVSERSDWRQTFVDPGYGLACDPQDPAGIAQALRWFAANRAPGALMGEMGRQRILCDWNYERQFDPVFQEISKGKNPLNSRAEAPALLWDQ